MNDGKRQQREMKRDIKKAGRRAARRKLRRDLETSPEDAAHSEVDYGRHATESMNGIDNDATRKKKNSATDEHSC